MFCSTPQIFYLCVPSFIGSLFQVTFTHTIIIMMMIKYHHPSSKESTAIERYRNKQAIAKRERGRETRMVEHGRERERGREREAAAAAAERESDTAITATISYLENGRERG